MTTMQTPSPPMPSPAPPGQTTLMPLDPSPHYAMRILPIRANLLPAEITAGRHARRIRAILILAIVLVIGALGSWYLVAVADRDEADDQLASVTSQVDLIRHKTKAKEYAAVTATIAERDDITEQLKAAMAKDLPWSRVSDALRDSGVPDITITSFAGTLNQDNADAGSPAKAGAAAKQPVASLTIQGRGKDKKNIAAYLEAIAKIKGVTHVYLTGATSENDKWTFSIKASIAADRLCGRFTTDCGGK
jgi:hypothetical protein